MATVKKKSRSNFRPHLVRNFLWELTIEFLLALGIKGIILDLDNTFCKGNKGFEVSEENKAWLNAVKAAGIKVVILSNVTGGGARKRARVQEFGRNYGVTALPGAKPSRKWFDQAAEELGLAKDHGAILVIGDQMRTDIFGGNRAGMKTCLVRQLSKKEFFLTRYIVRPWEVFMLLGFGIRWPVPSTNPYDDLAAIVLDAAPPSETPIRA